MAVILSNVQSCCRVVKADKVGDVWVKVQLHKPMDHEGDCMISPKASIVFYKLCNALAESLNNAYEAEEKRLSDRLIEVVKGIRDAFITNVKNEGGPEVEKLEMAFAKIKRDWMKWNCTNSQQSPKFHEYEYQQVSC